MMLRIFTLLAFVALTAACTPPVRTIPRKVETGLDSTHYVGVVHLMEPMPDLRAARMLAGVKVQDRGWSLDCRYPEVVELARTRTMKLGGNLLVIREHLKPQSDKSDCHRIQADAYLVQSLEGLEAQIYWHPERPLQPGDLRGRPGGRLPEIRCGIQYRLLGDFYNTMNVRTITTFFADSTGMADGPEQAGSLRRAQLHFDLAEVAARQLKKELAARAPSVAAITKEAPALLESVKADWEARHKALDAELARAADPEQVLTAWENQVRAELENLKAMAGEQVLEMRRRR